MDILFVLIVCKNEAELRWLPTNATTECVLSDNNNVTIGVLVPCVWVLFINAAKQRFMRAHIFATHTTIDIEVKCARYSIYVQIDTSNAVRQFCLQLIWLCVNESPHLVWVPNGVWRIIVRYITAISSIWYSRFMLGFPSLQALADLFSFQHFEIEPTCGVVLMDWNHHLNRISSIIMQNESMGFSFQITCD